MRFRPEDDRIFAQPIIVVLAEYPGAKPEFANIAIV
jgi:hypothetical protein